MAKTDKKEEEKKGSPDSSPPKKKEEKHEIVLSTSAVTKYICPNANDEEVSLFLHQCHTWELDPFKREIYLIKYSPTDKASIVLGFESFLKRAERAGKLDGWKAWTTGSMEKKNFKAVVEISRKDWKEPFLHEVFWEEYCQTKKDGTLTKFWANKPRTMLKKVAISQGFRMCFPEDLGGMPYVQEEMPPAQVKADVEIIDVEPEPEPEEKGKSPAELKEPPVDYESPADKDEKAKIIKWIQADLKVRNIDYPTFKEFLSNFQTSSKLKTFRCFVALNEHNKWSLNAADVKNLRILHENWAWTVAQYAESITKEEEEKDDIPF